MNKTAYNERFTFGEIAYAKLVQRRRIVVEH